MLKLPLLLLLLLDYTIAYKISVYFRYQFAAVCCFACCIPCFFFPRLSSVRARCCQYNVYAPPWQLLHICSSIHRCYSMCVVFCSFICIYIYISDEIWCLPVRLDCVTFAHFCFLPFSLCKNRKIQAFESSISVFNWNCLSLIVLYFKLNRYFHDT